MSSSSRTVLRPTAQQQMLLLLSNSFLSVIQLYTIFFFNISFYLWFYPSPSSIIFLSACNLMKILATNATSLAIFILNLLTTTISSYQQIRITCSRAQLWSSRAPRPKVQLGKVQLGKDSSLPPTLPNS